MKRSKLLYAVLLFLYGILAALPVITGRAAPLSFVLWTPFAYHVKTKICDTDVSLRRAYGMGLCFFMGYFMAAFSFFLAMYPLDFAGLSEIESVGVLFAAMVLLPLFQAVPMALSPLALRFLAKRKFLRFPCAYSLFFASVITVLFHLQNFTWAGVPWASPAVGLASSPLLIQSASLLGSGFLVFLLLFVNALLAEGYDRFRACEDKKSILAVSLALLLFLSHLGAGAFLSLKKPSEKTVKVALIQGCAPISEYYTQNSVLNTCRHLASQAAKEGADVMLWSETVLERSLERDKSKEALFSSIAKDTGAIQIVGAFSTREENGEELYRNALFLFYPDGTLSEEVYYKRRPVPFGEYLPMAELFEILLPALTEISMLSRDMDAGEGAQLFRTEAFTAGGLICFDSIYPALARESAADGAELLLLATNDSWFDGSFGKALHRSHAVLRAVENGRALARTGNTGYSVLITERGEILAEAPLDESEYIVGELSLSDGLTLYTRMGDIFVYLCAAFVLLCPIAEALYARKKEVN